MLDANIVIELFAGNPQVNAAFNRVADVLLPAIVCGEPQYGALKSARCTETREQLDLDVLDVAVVDIDMHTARTWRLRQERLVCEGVRDARQ